MPPPTSPPPPNLLSAKQVEKLELEIASLQKKKRWWETLTQFLPVLTALISVAGLVTSVLIFGRQQSTEQEKNRTARELERRTTLQNKISSDTDEILRFTGDPKLTVARVAFLLADIQTILDSPINHTALDPADNKNKKLADVLPGYKDNLTRSLVILVRDDCDFRRRSRDALLANVVVAYWSDYSDYLAKNQKNLDKLSYILWEYAKALERFHDQNPGYLESFYLEGDGILPSPRYARKENEDLLFNHLIDLTDGFRMHLKILCKETMGEKAKELKRTSLEEFQTRLSNPVLSNYLLESELNGTSCKPPP